MPRPRRRLRLAAADLLLDGLALLITEGHTAATPTLRKALTAFHSEEIGTEEGLRWLWLAGRTGGFIWDYERWDSLTARQVRAAREVGALGHLPPVLAPSRGPAVRRGAGGGSVAGRAVGRSRRSDLWPNRPRTAHWRAAFRGSEDELTGLVRTNTKDFITRGEGVGLTVSQWVTATLYNGLARYGCVRGGRAGDHKSTRAVVLDLRDGRADRSRQPQRQNRPRRRGLRAVARIHAASGTPWALGVEARSRALLSRKEAAEALYQESIDRLQPTRLRLDLARAHLLYGEWLRRQRRRLDARNQLRVAHELFADFGMEAFAERARVELQATGEHARKRTVDTLDQLTPQEAQIAHLTANGNTNREIAAQLFISPSTVEYHLRKVFRKLDVKSRTQLARRMS